ncbi:MAG: beta-galactosidase [Comamonas sp.]
MKTTVRIQPRSAPQPWRPLPIDRFIVGTPHYPEHVDPSFLARDARRMVECGFNTIRIAEFAWNLMEPREGKFDFGLFDETIRVFGAHGIDSILCTPTATPPRWLTHRYPEVLRVDSNGRRARHGSRQQADTCSPLYRLHSRRITQAMAEHFKDTPHVIGWQTDNELNTTVSESYSEGTAVVFRGWLQDQYGSIDAVNRAWGTNFWAQTYDSFDQIDLPFQLAPSFANPSQLLDFHRFLAHSTAMFQRDQVEILRKANPGWFIFHNVGVLRDLDFRGPFAEDLDFLGFDIYPFLRDELQRTRNFAHAHALFCDVARGHTGHFIVPEQQSGLGSQPGFATVVPEEGEMMRMAMSSISRGADGMMFFRWRPAHYGAEIYWNGILDHDDVPRRRFREAQRFGRTMQRIGSKVLGTVVRVDVGIAGSSFDNEEAHRTYPLALPEPQNAANTLHRYCYEQGIACGFVHPTDDLSKLKMLFVPHWVVWMPEWTAAVERFVRAGGILVVGARTATRNRDNHVIAQTPPGAGLSALCGMKVEEFGLMAPVGANGLSDQISRPEGVSSLPARPAESARRQHFVRIGDRRVQASHCYELLSPDVGTEVLATWDSRFIAGSAAVTARAVGRGHVLYVGTYVTDDVAEALIPKFLELAGVTPLLQGLPAGVEVTLREGEGHTLMFLQNTRAEAVKLASVPAGVELIGNRAHEGGELNLEPYGCAVVQLE